MKVKRKFKLKATVIAFLFLFVASYICPIMLETAIAQKEEPPLTPIANQSFFDNRVLYASNWASVAPVKWYDARDGKEYDISAGQYITVPNAPRARVITSPMRKVSEAYLGVYPSGDGRDVIVKEYTLEFDACVYTIDLFSDYYGPVTPIEKSTELYRLEIWVKPLLQPWREDESQRASGSIILHGFDLTPQEFEARYADILTGNLIFQTKVDTAIWRDVFGDRGPLVYDNGNWTYADDVYSSVREVVVKTYDTGLLEETERPTLIQDSASALDGKKGGDSQYEQPASRLALAGKNYLVQGYYNPELSYIIEVKRPSDAQGDPVGTPEVTYYGPEVTRAVLWSNRGYDPSSEPADTVFFLPAYTLRPQQNLYQYKYTYHYESWQIEDWVVCYAQHTPKVAAEKAETMTVGWELWNYWVYNTFQMKVVVGAYYQWTPLEPTSDVTLKPPTRDQGDLTFPVVTTGTEAGGAIGVLKQPTTLAIIFFGVLALYVGVQFIQYRRSEKKWYPGFGRVIKWLAFGLVVAAILTFVIWLITLVAGFFGWIF